MSTSDPRSSGHWRILWFSKSDAIEQVYDRTDWDWQQCEAWLDAKIAAGEISPMLADHFGSREQGQLLDAIDRELHPAPTEDEVDALRDGLVGLLREALRPDPPPVAPSMMRQPVGAPEGLEDWYIKEHVPAGYSDRDEDLAAARSRFGPWTKDRDTMRWLRDRHAPDSWKKAGPKIWRK